MNEAVKEGIKALDIGEVPCGCVFVHHPKDGSGPEIIARGHNKTNEFRNATKHAELVAINDILMTQKLSPEIFRECDL